MRPTVDGELAPRFLALPYAQGAIEAGQVTADGLISITGSNSGPARVDECLFADRVLRLAFDDIPTDAWTDPSGNAWRGPAERHVQEALAFARLVVAAKPEGQVFIAVHCKQGKSRSAGIALALIADELGPGQEMVAVRLVLQGAPSRQLAFNPGIVRMADAILGRGQAIEHALAAACPAFLTWRAYWADRGCFSSGSGIDI